MYCPKFLKVLIVFVYFTAVPGILLAQTSAAQEDQLGDEEAAAVTGFLENPGSNSFQSGIGVISGWVCEADEVVIALNGVPQPAAYGTERRDTEALCGDSDNGFWLLFNWNLLGDGEHTVVALVDDVEFGRATVTVTTPGTEFLRDGAGTCTVEDFPSPGESVTLEWQQTTQNFVMTDGTAPDGTNHAGTPGVGYLENPGPNSFQSGIGAISGWVCDADEVVIEVGDLAPQVAAYGTERRDTLDVCGDSDNGFGLLVNWNLLGDGEHEVVALVDGQELGRAAVRVTTLGTEFVQGVAGECAVEDFPTLGQTVTLVWQQNSQSFVIAGETPDRLSTLVDELKANAEAFEYTIGQPGGALTFATISEPLTFNLAVSKDSGSSGVLGHLFEGLTETSWLTAEVEPALAESWTHSEDGLTWTFRLRQDVRWHDGAPFTAHDVAFTFNDIIYNSEIDASARPAFNFRFLDEETGAWKTEPMTVVALDDYTIRFDLPVPFAPFLRSMGTPIYPEHILKPYVDDGTFSEVWDINTDPSEIIGTGPFTIESYDPSERVVFRRNPDYWLSDDAGNPLPYLDEIVYVIVPDLETELAKFKAGESDVHGVLGEEFAELEPLQAQENFTLHKRGPGFGSEFLTFNVNPEAVLPTKLAWFQNIRFRQAVAHVVDKDRIIDEVQHGLGYPQWSSVSPAAGDFHNPDVRRYEYSIAEADRILNELGWLDTDGDGTREDDKGNPIMFSLVTNAQNSVREQIGAIIQQGLEDVGIAADFQLIEWGDLVNRLVASYDWEAVFIGFTGGPDPYSGISLWHSSESLHLWHPNQTEPATAWEAEIDDLYIRASQELAVEERVRLYHRAQAIAAENVPLIYTTLGERLSAVRNVFGNTTPTLYGIWDTRYLYRTDQ